MGDLLKDRVAIVTGAGRGTGGTRGPADEVVALVREHGGEAVANYDSVADFEAAGRIVQTVINHYIGEPAQLRRFLG